jgi:predicted transcriptional regulator
MSTTELKANFHKLIDRIQDEEQLRDMYEAVADYAFENGELDALTPDQIERIKNSLDQYERGEAIPHETVMQNLKQWLGK